jgi:two-component system, response regulator PdtaR
MTGPHAAPSSSDRGPGNRPPVPAEPNRETQRARILIVEDEWLVSTEMEAVLEQEGFETVGVATSAEEAVLMVEQHKPDLVLMDIRLKGPRDGVDAAIEIQHKFGLRCLFVSAHHDPATVTRAQPANPLGWVSKPFSGQQLAQMVKEAIRSK